MEGYLAAGNVANPGRSIKFGDDNNEKSQEDKGVIPQMLEHQGLPRVRKIIRSDEAVSASYRRVV